MVTSLICNDEENIIVYPSLNLHYNIKFCKAYKKKYNSCAYIQCMDSYTCGAAYEKTYNLSQINIHILTEKELDIVNDFGLDFFNGLTFFKIPKQFVFYIKSVSNDNIIVFDHNKFILDTIITNEMVSNKFIEDLKQLFTRDCYVSKFKSNLYYEDDSDD